MSIDPYHAVQQEIQTSLQTASQLRSSYMRIRNMAKEDSEELMWARNEVSYTTEGLFYFRLTDLVLVEGNVSCSGSRLGGLGGERQVCLASIVAAAIELK